MLRRNECLGILRQIHRQNAAVRQGPIRDFNFSRHTGFNLDSRRGVSVPTNLTDLLRSTRGEQRFDHFRFARNLLGNEGQFVSARLERKAVRDRLTVARLA